MAWRCTGATNSELITNMHSNEIIRTERVAQAMEKVDRANYVLAKDKPYAYEDSPQPIGYGATISAPHMHAYAVEHLLDRLKPGARVLDVGSGSGYLAAVLHHLVSSESSEGRNGMVVGIEHITELVDRSIQNLQKDGLGEALESGCIEIVAGDGRLGYPSCGPYDVIHVGAAAPTVPQALIDQLASPGKMFIPVGTYAQHIKLVEKDNNGNVSQEKIMDVRYVPLTDLEKQRNGA